MVGLCRRFRLETLNRCSLMVGLCPRFRLETLSRCLPMVGLCLHCLPEDTCSLPYKRKLIIQAGGRRRDFGYRDGASRHFPIYYERDKMRP